jgi:hypothetical protein
MSGGGNTGAPQTVNQNVTNRTELPAWYSDYLQQVMGRALTQAGDQNAPPVQQVAGLTGDQQNAYQTIRNYQGSYQPFFNEAQQNMSGAGNINFQQAAAPGMQGVDYQGSIAPGMQGVNFTGQAYAGGQNLRSAEQGLASAAGRDTAGAADPFLNTGAGYLAQSAQGSALGSANPYIQQSVTPQGLAAASPYLQAASGSFPQSAGAYMSPYTSAVTDRLATLAGQNLKENLLPAVNDQFIRAGQYGSIGNRDTVGRAVRDTQDALLGQQAQALEQGYSTAGQLYNQDASRMAGLAGTAGGLGTAQQQALLQAGSTTGGLSSADLARMQGSGSALGQLGLGYSGAQATDAARAASAYGKLGDLGVNIGQLGLGAAQAQANYNLGQGNLGLNAAQAQGQYNLGQGNLGLNAASQQAQTLLNSGQGLQGLGNDYQNNAFKGATALEAAGAAQQGQQQNNLNSLYQSMMAQYNLPWQNISNLSSVIQGLPVNMSSSGSSTTTQPGPSALSQIGGVGLGLAGLANSGLFKAKGGAVRRPKYKSSHSYGSMPRKGLGFAEAA